MPPTNDDPEARRIIIEEHFGLFKVFAGQQLYSGATLESALGKAAKDAPEDYVHHAAEILDGLL